MNTQRILKKTHICSNILYARDLTLFLKVVLKHKYTIANWDLAKNTRVFAIGLNVQFLTLQFDVVNLLKISHEKKQFSSNSAKYFFHNSAFKSMFIGKRKSCMAYFQVHNFATLLN